MPLEIRSPDKQQELTLERHLGSSSANFKCILNVKLNRWHGGHVGTRENQQSQMKVPANVEERTGPETEEDALAPRAVLTGSRL